MKMQMGNKVIKRYLDQLNIKLIEMETIRYLFSTLQ